LLDLPDFFFLGWDAVSLGNFTKFGFV
jgi:hypothetical protein